MTRPCRLCGRKVADPGEYRVHKAHGTCVQMFEHDLKFVDGTVPGHTAPVKEK